MAAAVSQTVVRLRGRDVRFKEGDVVLTRASSSTVGWLVSFLNQGYSHMGTVVRIRGELHVVSVCKDPWVDQKGRRWPAGVTCEPLDTLGDPVYDGLWIVSPRVPRTEAQLALLRFGAQQMLRSCDHTGSTYDGLGEYCASFFGFASYSLDRWHCAEQAAVLAKQQGAYPQHLTASLSIPQVAAQLGDVRRIF